MRLETCLEEIGRQGTWQRFQHLRSLVGLEWVRQALRRTDTQTIRRRKLPNEAVVWLVIGIALFRDLSIDAVVKHLGLVRGKAPPRPSPSGSPVSSAAVAHARRRIGSGPLLELFHLTSQSWLQEFAAENLWRGLSLFAIDGSNLRIADTPQNEEAYGRPGSGRSKAAYPQARLVGVLAMQSRVLCDFAVGSQAQGEQSLARALLEKLPDHSLTGLDRGFVNYAMFARITAGGTHRHFLCRGKKTVKGRCLQRLGRNDSLIELAVPAAQRRKDPTLPETVTVRLIQYHIAGFRPSRLVTSLVDPQRFPAHEIVELYHKRWEIELAYDEIKTHTLEREETIRSRSPELVLQEIYGLLVAYNLVRVMMARAARSAGVEPARMSFRNSLIEIRHFSLLAPVVAPGNLPALYRKLCDSLALLVLPKRRPRRYPRAVKIKMSKFKRKDF